MVSLAAMLWVGGRNLGIPIFGVTEVVLNGYDAGSEANNERCTHVPGPPCGTGSGSMRMTERAEGCVSVHPRIRGDGGVPLSRDWRNPVARVVIIGPLARRVVVPAARGEDSVPGSPILVP